MRRRFVGVVVSDKMDKTRVVIAERMERHPLYKKEMRRNTNFMCMTKTMFLRRATSSSSRNSGPCLG